MKRQCPYANDTAHPGHCERSIPLGQKYQPPSNNLTPFATDDQAAVAVNRGSHGLLDNGNVYLVVHI